MFSYNSYFSVIRHQISVILFSYSVTQGNTGKTQLLPNLSKEAEKTSLICFSFLFQQGLIFHYQGFNFQACIRCQLLTHFHYLPSLKVNFYNSNIPVSFKPRKKIRVIGISLYTKFLCKWWAYRIFQSYFYR